MICIYTIIIIISGSSTQNAEKNIESARLHGLNYLLETKQQPQSRHVQFSVALGPSQKDT
jgi:hypothetical protein